MEIIVFNCNLVQWLKKLTRINWKLLRSLLIYFYKWIISNEFIYFQTSAKITLNLQYFNFGLMIIGSGLENSSCVKSIETLLSLESGWRFVNKIFIRHLWSLRILIYDAVQVYVYWFSRIWIVFVNLIVSHCNCFFLWFCFLIFYTLFQQKCLLGRFAIFTHFSNLKKYK